VDSSRAVTLTGVQARARLAARPLPTAVDARFQCTSARAWARYTPLHSGCVHGVLCTRGCVHAGHRARECTPTHTPAPTNLLSHSPTQPHPPITHTHARAHAGCTDRAILFAIGRLLRELRLDYHISCVVHHPFHACSHTICAPRDASFAHNARRARLTRRIPKFAAFFARAVGGAVTPLQQRVRRSRAAPRFQTPLGYAWGHSMA
jgi:hypothetical protein